MTPGGDGTAPPSWEREMDSRRVAGRSRGTKVIIAVVILALGILWLRPVVRWYSCGADVPVALFRGAVMGSPSDLECLAAALEDDHADEPNESEPGKRDDWWSSLSPTTEDPEIVERRRRAEEEQLRAEQERQAEVDARIAACWDAFHDEMDAWQDEYADWLAETGSQGDYDVWLKDNPQPVDPLCE